MAVNEQYVRLNCPAPALSLCVLGCLPSLLYAVYISFMVSISPVIVYSK